MSLYTQVPFGPAEPKVLFDPAERLSFPQGRQCQRHVAYDVIEITETMSRHEALRFPGDVAGADQLAEDALELLAADLERASDVFEPNAPHVRTRQQIAKHALGLDREPPVGEQRIRHDGEMRPMLSNSSVSPTP